MDGVFCTQYSVVWTPSQAASLAQPTSFVCHWTSDPVQTRPRPEKETDSPGSLPCAWGAEYSYIVSTQVAPVPAPQHVVIRDPPEFKFKPWRGSSESKRSKARLSQHQQAFPPELQERAPATSTSAQPHPSSPASSCTRQRQNRAVVLILPQHHNGKTTKMTKTVVVLGGSLGGLHVAHALLKKGDKDLKVILVTKVCVAAVGDGCPRLGPRLTTRPEHALLLESGLGPGHHPRPDQGRRPLQADQDGPLPVPGRVL